PIGIVAATGDNHRLLALVTRTPDPVADHVVAELAVASHLPGDRQQLCLGVATQILQPEPVIVPVHPGRELAEVDRIARENRQHQTGAAAIVGQERLTVVAATQLVTAIAPNVWIEIGIEREQNPHVAIAVDPEHHEVAVPAYLDLDVDPVAGTEVAAIVDEQA